MKTAEEIIDKYFSYNEFDKKRVVQAMQEYAEQFASQDKWISVENLDEKESFEALCFADGEYLYGWLYKKNGSFHCEIDDTLLECVTHYLLPTPPKTK